MDLVEFRPLKRKNLMGESKKDALRVNFDKKIEAGISWNKGDK